MICMFCVREKRNSTCEYCNNCSHICNDNCIKRQRIKRMEHAELISKTFRRDVEVVQKKHKCKIYGNGSCDKCGKSYKRNNYTQRFCSTDCAKAARREFLRKKTPDELLRRMPKNKQPR